MDRKMKVFWTGEKPAGEPEEFDPPMDIYETEDSLVMEVELPGMDKTSLHLFVEGDKLIMEGSKTEDEPDKNALGERLSFLQIERKFGRFYREISLPVACNSNEAKAAFEQGVLTVRMPVIKEKRGRRKQIPIE